MAMAKKKKKRAEQVVSGGELIQVGEEENIEKAHRRVNMVQMLCTQVCKWKNENC
jgi:hypothetical protein